MFQGRWPNSLSLDPKNRLALPARFRGAEVDKDGNEEFMVGKLQDACLYLHTPGQHQRFLDRIYRQLGDSRNSRQTKTYVLSRFVPVPSDSQGRLTLPAWLLEVAEIRKDVLLISQESRVEIWGQEVFDRLRTEVEGSGINDVLDTVFAEEERELRSLRRAQRPVGEGNPSG